MRALTSTAAGLALLATSAGAAKAKPRDAILLSQVESLTLRADRQTTHRRVPAVPQLKCVSPQAVCSKYKVDVMRCENKGSGYDDEDVQWSCSASLPPELKLGSTDVVRSEFASTPLARQEDTRRDWLTDHVAFRSARATPRQATRTS